MFDWSVMLSDDITNKLEDIARAIYYAKQMNNNRHVEVHLDRILDILEIESPLDVNLSKSVLQKKKE